MVLSLQSFDRVEGGCRSDCRDRPAPGVAPIGSDTNPGNLCRSGEHAEFPSR
jgi:hypothetical protein